MTDIHTPKYVVVNYEFQKDNRGRIFVDKAGRVEFHANLGPSKSKHAIMLYELRRTGKFFVDGNKKFPIYDGKIAGSNSSNTTHKKKSTISNAGLLARADAFNTTFKFRVKDNQIIVDTEAYQAADAVEREKKKQEFKSHYLFFIHGFNSNPEDVFKQCQEYQTKQQQQQQRLVIPVLWACATDGIWGYSKDRRFNAPLAAEALAPLLRIAYAFPQRSLLCHSMGNYVLQGVARAFFEKKRKFLQTSR